MASLEDEEDTVDVSEEQRLKDPYNQALISRVIDGQVFNGQVVNIEEGAITKERLYRIRYEDGDLEHFTPEMIKTYCVKPRGAGEKPAKRQKTVAADVDGEEDTKSALKRPSGAVVADNVEEQTEEDDEEESQEEEEEQAAVSKKPAAGANISPIAMKRPAAASEESIKKVAPESTKGNAKAKAKGKAKPSPKKPSATKKSKGR